MQNMVKKCCICGKEQTNIYFNLSFHKFPNSEEECNKWKIVVGKDVSLKSALICSNHFHRDDFINYDSKRRLLKKDIVPSRNLRSNSSLLAFPVDPERRMTWFSIVGLENRNLPKQPEICSEYFNTNIIIKENGLRYINPGSTPIPTNTLVTQSEDSTSSISVSSVFKTPPRKVIGFHNASSEATVISPASTDSSLKGVPFKEKNVQVGEEIQSSTRDALSAASEAEKEILKLSNIGPSARYKTVPRKAVSKKRKIYVGDISSSDFSTSKKRKRHLEIVKRTVAKQRKCIQSLQMSVRRLKPRISFLQSLLKYLKEKSLV